MQDRGKKYFIIFWGSFAKVAQPLLDFVLSLHSTSSGSHFCFGAQPQNLKYLSHHVPDY